MRCVLVLEDEPLIAELIQDWLVDHGCQTVLITDKVTQALAILEQHAIDAAILDWSLGSDCSDTVADALQRRAIPFAFTTGRDVTEISERYQNVPTMPKPFTYDGFAELLTKLA